MNFLKSIINYDFKRFYDVKIPDGKFSLINCFTTTADFGFNRFSINTEARTDFTSIGKTATVITSDTPTNHSGINKKYISDDGTYNFEAALAEFATIPMGKRLGKEEQLAVLKSTVGRDSHEAFIFNMLVTWYIARLYVDSGATDKVLKIQHKGLENTHVDQSAWGYDSRTFEIPVGPPNYDIEIEMIYRNASNYWERPYVLHYSTDSNIQTAFYIAHLAGRTGGSGLMCDIPIPAMDTTQLVLDPVGNVQHLAPDFNAVPWTKPDTIWQWILEYVNINRVQHAYAASLEMLGSLVSQPVGSFHESKFWHDTVTTVHLSSFAPTRARVRTNLSGEPYLMDVGTLEFVADSGSHPKNFLVNAAVCNYAFWLAVPALIIEASEVYDNPFDVFEGGHSYTMNLDSVSAKALMISAMYNKEMPTYANDSAFVTYNISQLSRNFVDLQLKGDTPGTITTLKSIPQYLSGSLLLGTLTTDMPTLEWLSPSNTFSVQPHRRAKRDDAIKASIMYRLFGYDCGFTQINSDTHAYMYANGAECLVQTASVLDSFVPDANVVLSEPRRRDGRGVDLPRLATVYSGNVSYSFSTPELEVVEYGKRTKPLVARVVLDRPTKVRTFAVRSGVAFRKEEVKLKSRAAPAPGFHSVTIEPTPQVPGPAATAHTALISGVDDEELAPTAE